MSLLPRLLGRDLKDPLGLYSQPAAEPDGAKPASAPPREPSRAAAAQPAEQAPSRPPLPEQDWNDLVDTVIAEAGGEGPEGMAAVAHVIQNRARSRGQDVGAVIRAPSQFEGYEAPSAGSRRAQRDPAMRAEAERVIADVMAGMLPDPTGGADHFHADYVSPGWARSMPKTVQIGGHHYYASGQRARAQLPDEGPVPQDRPDPTGEPAPMTAFAGAEPSRPDPFSPVLRDGVAGNPEGKGMARLVPPEPETPVGGGGALHFRHEGQDAIRDDFRAILEDTSRAVGRDLSITSGYRSPSHRVEARKKTGPGEHSRGHASDISMAGMSVAQRRQLVRELQARGVKRFGLYKNTPDMLHVDMKDQTGGGTPWFMYDRSNRNMGRAPEWFQALAKEDAPAPVAAAQKTTAKPIVMGEGFETRDPMGLYSGGNSPFSRAAAPQASAPAPAEEPGTELEQHFQQLEAQEPGRYEMVDATAVPAWREAWQAEQPGLAEDLGRMLGGSVIEGVGHIVRGIGAFGSTMARPTVENLINPIFGTEFQSSNPLGGAADAVTGAGQSIKEGVSVATREAIEASTPDGDLLDPASWTLGENPNLRGYTALALDVLGSMTPVLAASVLAGPTGGLLAGGAQGGGAAEKEAQQIVETLAARGELEQESAYYREQLAAGRSEAEAVAATKQAAGQMAFLFTAPISGLGGAATGKIIDPATQVLAGRNIVARIAGRGGLSAFEEGTQEAAEQVATRHGVNVGADLDLSVTEGTFGDFVLGALGGAAPGVAAGAISSREAPAEHPAPVETAPDAPAEVAEQAPPPQVAPRGRPLARAVEHGRAHAGPTQEFIVQEPAMGDLPAGPLDGQRVRLAPDQSGTPDGMRKVVTEAGEERFIGTQVLAPAAPVLESRPDIMDRPDPTPSSIPDGAPPVGATVRVESEGVEPFMARVESYENGEAVVFDAGSGEVYQVPVEAMAVLNTPSNTVPEAPPSEPIAGEMRTEMPPEAQDMPALQRFPGPPEPGQRAIISADGVERVAGRIESYEEGDTEALVVRDDGVALQVPLENLYVNKLTRREVEAEDLKRNPPVERDRAAGPTLRDVGNRQVDLPDDRHARLFDIGRLRRDSRKTLGASQLDMDSVSPAEQSALADAFGVSVQALGQMADDYRYRVERAAKEARSALPVKMHTVNERRLKQWQAERRKADPAAVEADPDSLWWDGELSAAQRSDLLQRAGVKRSERTQWRSLPKNLREKVLAVRSSTPDADVVPDAGANEAATSPTNGLPEPSEAQKEAGNYKMGRMRLAGLDLSIENPAGSTRSGTDRGGKAWSVTMKSHYGYIRGTRGRDKDHIDMFVKPGTAELADDAPVFVVDQVAPDTGRFDEHKVMAGYGTHAEAEAAYRANYTKGWKGLGDITESTVGEFKAWLAESDTTKPYARRTGAATVPVRADANEERFREIDEGFAKNRAVLGSFSKGDAVEFTHAGFYRKPQANGSRDRVFSGTVVAVSDRRQGVIEVRGEGGTVSYVQARHLRKIPDADKGEPKPDTKAGNADGDAQKPGSPTSRGETGDGRAETARKALREAESKAKKPSGQQRVAKNILGADVGDVVIASGAIDYSEAGHPYRIAQINRTGAVYVTSTSTGAGTTWSFGDLLRARNEGVNFEKVDPASSDMLFSAEGPAVTLTGDELGTPFRSREDMPALRRAASAWYDRHLRGTTVTMRDGSVVSFNQRGRNKTVSGKGDVLLRAVPAIRDIIENGTVVLREPGDRAYVTERVVVAAPVEIAGETRSFAVTLHRTADGHLHYDLHVDIGAGGPGIGARLAGGEEFSADSKEGTASTLNLVEWRPEGNVGAESALSEGDRQAVRDIIRDVAGLDDVTFTDRITLPRGATGWGTNAPTTASGFYDPAADAITVATSAARPERVAYHEAFHRLQRLFMSDAERGVLRAELGRLRRMVRSDPSRRAQADGMSATEIEAEAFAIWAAARGSVEPHRTIRAVWGRISQALRRVARFLQGKGFATAEDVFARAAEGAMRRRPAQARGSAGQRQYTVTEARVVDEVRGRLTDMQPHLLKAVPLNYFPELARPGMTAVDTYLKVKRRLDAYRGRKHAEADAIGQEWLKFSRLGYGKKGKARAAELADLMHAATLAGADPSKTDKETTEKPGYAELRKRYLALPPAGQKLFNEVRDAYKAQAAELDQILLDNVRKAQEIARNRAEKQYREEVERISAARMKPEARQQALEEAERAYKGAATKAQWSMKARLTRLRQAFEASRVQEPYFPLARFGRYTVTVRDVDGTVLSFSRRERAADRNRLARDMAAAFPTARIETGVMENANDLRGAMDPRIVAEMEEVLGGAGLDPSATTAVLDSLWQRYLETMPDLSTRKRFIHRKGTAGFDADALRAFSSHMFHAAHQMGRLKFGLELQELVNEASDQARKSDDATRGMTLANELRHRHQWVMNPTGSKVAQTMTSAAFVWFLGATPAAALVNLTQTPMMGIPILGARFGGMTKAAVALARASADSVRGRGTVRSADLSADEKRAVEAFYESGLIDRTQSHDLAGVGETGVEYSPLRARMMAIVSWMFHNAEVWNREVTGLAAYRMARAAGQDEAAAIDAAHDLTWKVHFDYGNSSRPRLLQSDTAKVALVFRAHQINMIYRVSRDIHQALKGESPQTRKEARTQLAGVFGMMALMAGTTGVMGFNVMMTVAGAIFGDDDDPFDFEQKFKADVLDVLGPELGGVVLNGVPGHYLGVDLVNRIGLADIWFRSPGRDLQARQEYTYWVQQVLGATVGMGENIFLGIDTALEGDLVGGIQRAAPKFVRDAMKAWNYVGDGLVTGRGDQVIAPDQIDAWEVIAQAMGFTPAKVSEAWERNSALKNAEQRILDRRRELINRFALARQAGDEDARRDATDAIKRFNGVRLHRGLQITPDSLRQSLRVRARNADKREDGVLIQNERLGRELRERLPERMY